MAYERQLRRLSRESLTDLCVKWTQSPNSTPYLKSNRHALDIEEDYLHEPAVSRKELRNTYRSTHPDLLESQCLSKNELIDRIVNGDWRRGLSFEQLADIDFALLRENNAKLRWSALELVPLQDDGIDDDAHRPVKRSMLDQSQAENGLPRYPSTTPAHFIRRLRSHTSALVKAYSHIEYISEHGLSVVRLQVVPNTPFAPLSTNISPRKEVLNNNSRSIFIALPDSCPYLYVSVSGAVGSPAKQTRSRHSRVDIAASKRIILEAIPKAFSSSQQRWALRSTNLISTSLKTMTALRSSMIKASTGGSLSRLNNSDWTAITHLSAGSHESPAESSMCRKRRVEEHSTRVETRFGPMEGATHVALPRFQVRVKDIMQPSATSTKGRNGVLVSNDDCQTSTPISISLCGSDVLTGLKLLALAYPDLIAIDKLPGALTGESGGSSGNI